MKPTDRLIQSSEPLPDAYRAEAWRLMIEGLELVPDREARAVCIQSSIAELGPVPNELGDRVRTLLHDPAFPSAMQAARKMDESENPMDQLFDETKQQVIMAMKGVLREYFPCSLLVIGSYGTSLPEPDSKLKTNVFYHGEAAELESICALILQKVKPEILARKAAEKKGK